GRLSREPSAPVGLDAGSRCVEPRPGIHCRGPDAGIAAGQGTAESATRVKADFLATMSHEIRTPMNAILGMLYLALKDDMPSGVRGRLVKAQGAAQSLLGIINDILDFSKLEARSEERRVGQESSGGRPPGHCIKNRCGQ